MDAQRVATEVNNEKETYGGGGQLDGFIEITVMTLALLFPST